MGASPLLMELRSKGAGLSPLALFYLYGITDDKKGAQTMAQSLARQFGKLKLEKPYFSARRVRDCSENPFCFQCVWCKKIVAESPTATELPAYMV